MNKIDELFFELVRVSLGTQDGLSHQPTTKEWQMLYNTAKKQSLLGICFVGVQTSTLHSSPEGKEERFLIPELLYLRWMGMAVKIQQRNSTVNQQCVTMQTRLVEDGFRSCVLKGQGVAARYGKLSDLRQSGDIDLYVEGGMDRVLRYVQRVAPTNKINHKHVQLHVFEDTEVELHFIPAELHCPWQNCQLQKFFGKWTDRECVMLSDGAELTIPCPEFQTVHILTHAYRHLFGDGIGMRQVMDLYFVLRTLPPDADKEAITGAVSAAGMERFAAAMMWVLSVVFNLEIVSMLWEPNPIDGQFLLREIMLAGNFGHHDERINRNGESRGRRFWRVTKQNWQLLRFSPWEVICTPLWRIWHFIWMRSRGYTQG